MENLTFEQALEMAESLDTQEINYYFGEKRGGTTIFAGENNIVSIFQRLTNFGILQITIFAVLNMTNLVICYLKECMMRDYIITKNMHEMINK